MYSITNFLAMLVIATTAFALQDQIHDSPLSRSRLRSNRHRAQAHEIVERQSVTGSTYVGCVQDGAARLLTGSKLITGTMTVDICTKNCDAQGYTYAGLEGASNMLCTKKNADILGTNECYVSLSATYLDMSLMSSVEILWTTILESPSQNQNVTIPVSETANKFAVGITR
jgi:hypothetical protein